MPFRTHRCVPVTILLSLFIQTASFAQLNWPRFRGENGTGVSPDNDQLPSLWSKTENVVWKTDVPGWGWSNAIVWGERVFLTTVVADEGNTKPEAGLYLGAGVRDPAPGNHHWMVYCFDLNSGKEIWKHEAHSGEPQIPRHPKSTYAAETPTTDGERVYALFGDVGLYCYDLDGNPLWKKEIPPKETFFDYGAAASPVVHDGRVIIVYDNKEKSWLASIDAKTGDEQWRVDRDETHSWATPLIWQNSLRTEIVVNGKNRNRSYDLDGKLLWEFDGNMSNLVIPSPFAAHDMCYVSSGYVGDQHRPTFAIKPGAKGDITPDGDDYTKSEFIAWYQGRSAPYNPSQIVYGDYLYTLYDRGFLTCHDAKTGEEVYGKRRFSPAGTFTSSPWAYNGYLFCISEKGLTYVVEAGPEFRIVGRNDLDELCLATPSAVGDKLLIRTATQLYCLSGGKNARDVAVAELDGPSLDIWSAISEGNLKAVEENLAHDPESLTAANPLGGSTTLATAVMYRQTDIVKLLMEKGADVNKANPDGNTPLHVATFVADEEIVALLIDKGAKIDAKNKKGETPLKSVEGDWSEDKVGTYKYIGNLIDREFDIERIKQARPAIAKRLLKTPPEQN